MVGLSLQKWIRHSNSIAVATLFLLMVLTVTFSLKNDAINFVSLRLATNVTETKQTSEFNIGAVFRLLHLDANVGAHDCRVEASVLESRLFDKTKIDSRAACFILVMPLMHAAVLIGVAKVIDTWAVFASFLLTIIILMLMFIFKQGGKQLRGIVSLTGSLVVLLYVSFWVLAWASGEHSKLRTAQLAGFTAGLSMLLITYFIVLKKTNSRIDSLKSESSKDEARQKEFYGTVLKQEALYICISVGFTVVSVTTWVCYTSKTNPGKQVALILSAAFLLQTGLTIFIFYRMKSVIYNKPKLDVVRQQFLDAGISSDNDDNEDDALTENSQELRHVAANVGIDESDTMQLVNITSSTA